jgi:hypothetical protein
VTRIPGFVFAATLATASIAAAQETPPPPPPVQAPPASVQQPTPPPAAPAVDTAAKKPLPEPMSRERFMARRNAVAIFEGALIKAVGQGANEVMRQIKERQGAVAGVFTGYAKAHGFILENYGLMFHVEIPGVRANVVNLVEQFQRNQQQALPRAERTGEGATTTAAFDIDAAYTDAVKNTLIDTMLTYSVGLDLDADEWLTIAARDGDLPPPGTIYESITLILRVRGGDLAEFHAKRLSREDMLKRLQVRGF